MKAKLCPANLWLPIKYAGKISRVLDIRLMIEGSECNQVEATTTKRAAVRGQHGP